MTGSLSAYIRPFLERLEIAERRVFRNNFRKIAEQGNVRVPVGFGANGVIGQVPTGRADALDEQLFRPAERLMSAIWIGTVGVFIEGTF
jgi:hypothetical protein